MLGVGVKPYVANEIKEVIQVIQSYFDRFERQMMGKIELALSLDMKDIRSNLANLKKVVNFLMKRTVQVSPSPLPPMPSLEDIIVDIEFISQISTLEP